ncbi:unnamed protein product [Moneuplotes crassus]|uniref:Mitochondrial carrier protein n=1 Tax=Euplotes crassus TaxID=5936 RepID=A0AAD2CXV8_EUPCR|nr:unnamed protein product [Moneuplotes crassus]
MDNTTRFGESKLPVLSLESLASFACIWHNFLHLVQTMNTTNISDTQSFSEDSRNLISGGISGICSMTATHPFERVKVMRILAIQEIAGKNLFTSIYTIAKMHGIRSVFRGNAVSCLREFPGAGLMFYFYEKFKTILTTNKNPDDADLQYRVLSGAIAGFLSSTITYCLDPVKTIMAGDFEGKAGNIRTILKNTYIKDGFRGFYHGYTATMCSVTPYIALNMACFDVLKSKFGRSPDSLYFSFVNMICGSVSGVICCCIIFPIESTRRRLQVNGQAPLSKRYNGLSHCVQKVYKRYGMAGFYYGLVPTYYKIFISAGVMFMVNEKIKQMLKT